MDGHAGEGLRYNAGAVKPLADIVGECPAINALRERAKEFLRRQSAAIRQPAVLIQGETGTGKGLLARAFHQSGPRASGPFVDVNCAAIPETLLEAELFGYERGAFTDARHSKVGLIQAAHTGTLFLDEIGLLPVVLQTKLLTVLEAGGVRRLGSTRSQAVNVSVIAATNEDLAAEVRAKRFREDLYHRLAVVIFTLPPLRERGEDVVLLAERFLRKLCIEYGISARTFDESALTAIQAYDWPGNVRELNNVIERAVLLSDSGVVTEEMLQLPAGNVPFRGGDPHPNPPTMDDFARQKLVEALTATSWNITRTAALLGLTRNTVRARIARYQLSPPAGKDHWFARRQLLASVDHVSRMEGRETDSFPQVGSSAGPVGVRFDRRRVAIVRVRLGDLDPLLTPPLEWNEPLKVMLEKIRSFGGTFHEVGACGVEGSFGLVPIDDAPRRAAHAGLAIQRELAKGLQKPMSRIVIHTCEVPVVYVDDTAQIDSQARREITPIVDALMESTGLGRIVASGTTAAFLRRRFTLEPVSALMPGLTPYNVLGHDQFTIGETEKRTPFVGRSEEISLLRARLDTAIGGRGQVVSVIGDPGVGKSRLVWEFSRLDQVRGIRLLESGCAYAAITPYLPIIDLLRRYLAIGAEDDPNQIREHLATFASSSEGANVSLAPLQALLGASGPDWDALDPVERRHMTLEAVKRLFLGESRRRPLIVMFEDVHWIDSESQAVLDAIVEVLPTSQMLLVVTYRPEYRHEWSSLSYYTQLNLGPLPSDSANDLLDGLLGTHDSLEPIKRHFVEWSDGNPLFLEEMVQALVETDGLRGPRGAYEATGRVPFANVPATIEDILAARIDRLTAQDKTVLQGAAAIGAEVSLEVLSAVVDVSGEGLRSSLRRLQAAELLQESGSTAAGNSVMFKHALTREVAYHSLPSNVRRDLHRRIVTAIEDMTLDSGPANIDRLARHAFEGELWRKAAAYFRQAGDKAMGSAAPREAGEYFQQALEALSRLTQSEQVKKDVIDLRLRMRDAFWLQLPASSMLDHLRAADAIAEEVQDRGRQGWIACYLCQYFWAVGDPDHALAEGERALAIGRAIDNQAVLAETNFYRGIVQLAIGDFRASVATLTETLEALKKVVAAGLDFPSRRFALHGPFILRSFLIRSLAELGEFREAIEMGKKAFDRDSDKVSPYASAAISGGLGLAYVRKGEPASAIPILENGLQLCRTYGLNNWIPTVAGTLGAAYVGVTRVEEGVELLKEAIEHGDRLGLGASNSVWVIFLGDGLARAGRRTEALTVAGRGLELCRQRKERGYEAWALRLLGDICAGGDATERVAAKEHYGAALAIGGARGMRPLIAHCLLGLARLSGWAGETEAAGEQLGLASAAFNSLGMALPLD